MRAMLSWSHRLVLLMLALALACRWPSAAVGQPQQQSNSTTTSSSGSDGEATAGQLSYSTDAEEGSGSSGWVGARATFFGNDAAWSIYEGTCGYGRLYPGALQPRRRPRAWAPQLEDEQEGPDRSQNGCLAAPQRATRQHAATALAAAHTDEPLGFNVAAIPDSDPASLDSCGRCVEVACNPTIVQDAFGNTFDRTQACLDPSASLVARVTDSCVCQEADGTGNQRWCCNDQRHLCISVWAWERLAPTKWGVMGIKYRPVSCDYTPAKVAPPVANPTPAPDYGNAVAMDKWSSSTRRPARPWPEFFPNTMNPCVVYNGGLASKQWSTTCGSPPSMALRPSPWLPPPPAPPASLGTNGSAIAKDPGTTIPAQGMAPPATAAGAAAAASAGPQQSIVGTGQPLCVSLRPNATFTLCTSQAAGTAPYQGRISVTIWVYAGTDAQGGAADASWRSLAVVVGSAQGECAHLLPLASIHPTSFKPSCPRCDTYWWKFEAFLAALSTGQVTTSAPQLFSGCGAFDVATLSTLALRNVGSATMSACVDHILLS